MPKITVAVHATCAKCYKTIHKLGYPARRRLEQGLPVYCSQRCSGIVNSRKRWTEPLGAPTHAWCANPLCRKRFALEPSQRTQWQAGRRRVCCSRTCAKQLPRRGRKREG